MAIMTRINPSVAVPGLLVPNVQQVPFERYIGKKTNFGSLGKEQAYITTIANINSETQVGQQWGSQMAKQTYNMGQLSVPYYRVEAYVEYNVDEQAKFEELSGGIALPDFLENLAKQGINQRRHQAILYGFDGATGLGQGLLSNAVESNLPNDSAGVQTLTGYDVAELQAFLASVLRSAMDASYGMAKPCVIASSSRVINYLTTAIVPLTESQKDGAGVDSVAGLFSRVAKWVGVGDVEFIQDNTLEGATGQSDKIVFIAPGLDQQAVSDEENINLVGQYNSINYNTWYDSAEGLMRFDAPPSMGTFGAKYTLKMTPGVTLRSEAVRVVSAKYA